MIHPVGYYMQRRNQLTEQDLADLTEDVKERPIPPLIRLAEANQGRDHAD